MRNRVGGGVRMDEETRKVVAAIDGITSVDGHADLDRLRELIDRYFALPDSAEHLDVWFRLYERFPVTDAEYAFWTILHQIETQPDWLGLVVASVRRKPSSFSVMMVNRLLNGGIASVGGVDLLDLLREVAADERSPAVVREDAEGYLEYQRSRA
jgi:hypothetical protein